jgi:hypothetical protein
MDEEIKQLQARIQELEQKKREEDERNRDPFRFLRERIERREGQIGEHEAQIKNPGQHYKQPHHDAIAVYMHENNCDLSIIQAFEKLQAQVEELRTKPMQDLLG